MTEIERIINNRTLKIPEYGIHTILRITGIKNAESVLSTAKEATVACLKNIASLGYKYEKWKDIIPTVYINFLDQLNENDFDNDHYLFSLSSIISDFKELRQWNWHSSFIKDDTITVIFKGSFHPRFIWLFHCQGVPLDKFYIEDTRYGNYSLETIKDVTTYKKFE